MSCASSLALVFCALLFDRCQHGQQHGRQNRDDGDDDEQFDEGEARARAARVRARLVFMVFEIIWYGSTSMPNRRGAGNGFVRAPVGSRRRLHDDGRRPRAIVPVHGHGIRGARFSNVCIRRIKIQGSGLFDLDLLGSSCRRGLLLPAIRSWIHKSYESGLLPGTNIAPRIHTGALKRHGNLDPARRPNRAAVNTIGVAGVICDI